ncbi:MAG: DUF4129 domain-containing protein [Salegentibacter sp.]|uniref:DUF4129 domain-containing protein n=1 Tax=Salegentibacter sp. TaxID=1903072 RepID=UPI0028707CCB|nr:DUF4129 domain-containing protein [Salegentibacter sp.]MDR9457179.1 DUF4129 domain-containing protein [Salegentibacter sp.]
MKKLLPVIAIFLFFFGKAFSQEDSLGRVPAELQKVEFDESLLEEWRNDKDFGYLERETSTGWWTQFKGWINKKFHDFMDWLFGSYEPGSILELFITILPYLLLLMVLFLVALLFVKLNPAYAAAPSGKEARVFFSEEEKIIKSEDISKLIKNAISEGNYRMAIRYNYLDTLRKMDKHGIIDYSFDKTNQDYLAEIKSEELQHQFKRITRIYEYSWYGEFQVSQENFNLAESAFLKAEEMIKTRTYA